MSKEQDRRVEDVEVALRQLALVDRIIGLEAELAQLRTAQAGVEVAALKSSLTWRVGRIVLAPALAVRRAVRRVRR